MLEPDEVKFKEAEILWCWEMFDRIVELCDSNPSEINKQVILLAKLGLKGRKDEWND